MGFYVQSPVQIQSSLQLINIAHLCKAFAYDLMLMNYNNVYFIRSLALFLN